jgi:ABC-type phosphate transport system substrate-binding protein
MEIAMKKKSSPPSLFTILRSPVAAIFAIAFVASMMLCVRPSEAANDPILVIVNNSNPIDNLSIADLKKLFLSDRSRWDTGKAVAPVMLTAGAPERTSFLKIVCGMSDADLGKYFMQAAFTGKSATPPKEVPSASAVRSFVAASPGAIGFLKAADLPPADTTVKVVQVDGVAASDPAYKLKM